MGISLSFLPFLFEEGKKKACSGNVLQLGRLAIDLNRDDLVRAAAYHNYPLTQAPDEPEIPYQFNSKKIVLNDQEFFKKIGFSKVDSSDIDTKNGNNIILDLNTHETPKCLIGQYDMIINGGTLEHVFHIPNALSNLHNLLKPDGRIFHISPASNFVDHGFYSFSPCFFLDYYETNGYDVSALSLVKIGPGGAVPDCELKLYPENAYLMSNISEIGSLDDWPHLVLAMAQKKPTSTSEALPIQGIYQSKPRLHERPKTPLVRNQFGKWNFPWQPIKAYDN